MGYSLPDNTLPYPPPQPPALIPLSTIKSAKPKSTRDFSRSFICMVGNYRNGKDSSVNIKALKEIFIASDDQQIGSQILRTNNSITIEIEKHSSIWFYVWTKGNEILDAVTVENIENGRKLIVFSQSEIHV